MCVPSIKRILFLFLNFVLIIVYPFNSRHILFLWRIFAQRQHYCKGVTRDDIYEWLCTSPKSKLVIVFSSIKVSIDQWHHRLGHPSSKVLHHLISNRTLPMTSSVVSNLTFNSNHYNKINKLPFSYSFLTSFPLELVYYDV